MTALTVLIFNLSGGTISWRCTKQKTVSLSSTGAEFYALCEAAKEALWLQNREQKNGTTIYEDNQSCMKLIANEKLSNRTKHIDVTYFYIREMIKQEKITLKYCCTEDMLADIMTKPLSNVRFSKLRNNLKLRI